MLYVAISLIICSIINKSADWYSRYRYHKISNIIKRGYIDSPDGRRLKIEK